MRIYGAVLSAAMLASGAGLVAGQTAPKPANGGATTQVATRPAGVQGEWDGELAVGEARLKLVLHVTSEKSGEVRARLDSPDQSVYGMEATGVSQEAGTLRFEIGSVGATFEGKLGGDGRTIAGEWKQAGQGFPLVFHRQSGNAAGKKPGNAISPLEGTWQGAFQNGNMRYRLQLHVTHDEEKKLSGTLDSLDQGANGLPMSKLSEQSGTVHFEIALVTGVYEGKMNAAHNAIAGTWSQNQDSVALEFKRSDEVLELRRPQNPTKPYPYKEEEVSFQNAAGTGTLAGTLTIPAGAGPFPAALLMAGSGPQNRDEFLAGHRPLLVLADALARKGFAVLRYDKRGIGKSTGDFAAATTEDFTRDGEAALGFLKARKEILREKIGVIGHSEGGLIAPILAAQGGVAWIVLLAAPGEIGEKTMLAQSKAISEAAGMPLEQVAQSLEFDRQAYATVREERDAVVLEKKLDAMVISSGMAEGALPATVAAQIHMLSSPWFRYFLDYDPAPALQKVKCPALVLNGSKDLQVLAAENLPLIQKALEDAGNKEISVREMPDLNHLLQHAESGTPAEYGTIEETISPEVLELITEWAAKHGR
ncbi:MAG TPA: alpha/beta fold hydrolase [Candidatus Acidoferrum sp.]|nr:alpha/beta fold hydrolase [Candidatus Acidoferrum sp.]